MVFAFFWGVIFREIEGKVYFMIRRGSLPQTPTKMIFFCSLQVFKRLESDTCHFSFDIRLWTEIKLIYCSF
jgi:hypothetical protein